MNKRTITVSLLVVLLLGALPLMADARADSLANIKLPATVMAVMEETWPTDPSHFDTAITGAGTGTALVDGHYLGWCGDGALTP